MSWPKNEVKFESTQSTNPKWQPSGLFQSVWVFFQFMKPQSVVSSTTPHSLSFVRLGFSTTLRAIIWVMVGWIPICVQFPWIFSVLFRISKAQHFDRNSTEQNFAFVLPVSNLEIHCPRLRFLHNKPLSELFTWGGRKLSSKFPIHFTGQEKWLGKWSRVSSRVTTAVSSSASLVAALCDSEAVSEI